jgi:inhibitor of cysteine peptidase
MENKILVLGLLILSVVLILGCTGTQTQQNNTQMANPASVYCEQHNGTLEIRTDATGGQVGYCKFADGSECEEWAYYRGECPAVTPGA